MPSADICDLAHFRRARRHAALPQLAAAPLPDPADREQMIFEMIVGRELSGDVDF